MLVSSLRQARNQFCNIGTRKLKLRLNKLSKENTDAEYIRRLLEVEDVNIRAKGTRPYYRKRVYRIKDRMLRELVDFCEKHNYTYGAQETDDFSTKEILYFELPDGIQVSFHCNHIPAKKYEKEWDKQQNSTLPKIEKYIEENFKDILK